MIDDMFNIVCDPIFNNNLLIIPESLKQNNETNTINRKIAKNPYVSKYKLQGKVFDNNCTKKKSHSGYPDDENLFEFICNLE